MVELDSSGAVAPVQARIGRSEFGRRRADRGEPLRDAWVVRRLAAGVALGSWVSVFPSAAGLGAGLPAGPGSARPVAVVCDPNDAFNAFGI